jgi:putative toxin-antitoxin system antitoxin component (TIGR02293 family)
MPTNTLLQHVLQSVQPSETPIDWHQLVSTGLPRSVLPALASEVGTTEKKLAEALAMALPKKKDEQLSADASEAVFRYSQVLVELEVRTRWSLATCAQWLSTPCALLRQRVPLHLLRSSQGFEYVTTAISRL